MHPRASFRVWMVLAALLAAVACLTASARPQPEGEPASAFEQAERAFAGGRYEAAATLYQQARQEGVDHALLHFRLGYALHVTGRVREALPHHLRGSAHSNRAIRIDCLYNAACAHALLGDAEASLRHLQYAVDTGFVDKAQVAQDADLDSLRQDARFVAIVEGIGVEPTLFAQLDFLLGDWEVPVGGDRIATLSFRRPQERSSTIFYQWSHPDGEAWAGSLIPDAAARTWTWSYCDDRGTSFRLLGEKRGNSFIWEGPQVDARGPTVRMRITQSTHQGGSIHERREYSLDGVEWHLHHEDVLRRASAEP